MSDPDPIGQLATPAVELRGVSKRYRLYHKPAYRFLDLFGLCPAEPSYYSEHVALNAIDLSVRPGEKVAIIGRNGAGKSTLLKIITSVVRQTSGSVTVRGNVSNLLQIGSGFHPDFTGRQNVHASLAHQGITGKAAEKLFDEILEFAEIGEYIDQPMKTYSTGMCSRLMFSSSVVIKPDILIVDEILGVGDAYFSHKSFERMREICTKDGTTLLLVTHAIYQALNLCDRFVWLDRGEIKFDGDGKAAISLYESSVKEQEEQALRQQNVARLTVGSEQLTVHVLIRSRKGFVLDAPLGLETLELLLHEGETSRLQVAEGSPGWTLVPEGNLGPQETFGGRPSRVLRQRGSIYHKAEWLVTLPPGSHVTSVRVRYAYAGSEPVDVRVFTSDRKLIVGGELSPGPGWLEARLDAGRDGTRELESIGQTDYGTGLLRIVAVEFLNSHGDEVVEVRHGEPLTVRLHVRLSPELVNRDAAFVLGFARHESPYSSYVYEPRVSLPRTEECTIEVRLDSMLLGSGQWYVNVGIGEFGLFDRDVISYFTVDSAWHHMHAARIEFRVTSETKVDTYGCFFTHPAHIVVSDNRTVVDNEKVVHERR